MEQSDLLRYVIRTLEHLGIPYVVVGAFASSAYGEPRATQDIDLVVRVDPEQVEGLCAAFPPEDYYVSIDAARDATEKRDQFNIIHPSSGNKVDLMVARDDPWGRAQMERRRRVPVFPDLEGFLASPEDVIIGKMIYYREGGSEKHLRDITGILRVSGADLDRDYITRWAAELGLCDIWEAIVRRVERH